jgi:hypothetical protein
MKRQPGFHADGFQDSEEGLNIDGFDNCSGCGAQNIDGFDNCCGCGMRADGESEIDDNFVHEYSFNANGEFDPDGEYNVNGERDEFVFNADGEYVGSEGEFNAAGEHFDVDGDEFQFNIDGEFAGVDGEYNAQGEHIDGFDNFRSPGFENAIDEDDDNFSNARGKKARQEKKSARVQARSAKKAAKVEIKKAKAVAKVEKKKTKTAAKAAKKAAKIERKNTRVNARTERKNTRVNSRVSRKAEASAARNAPVDLSYLMPTDSESLRGDDQIGNEVQTINEPIYDQNQEQNNVEEIPQEQVIEVETDPSMTNVEMRDEETGEPIVDMQEIDNFLDANGASNEDDDNDHFFISLPGAQRRKTRQAIRTAKKAGKAQAKIKKKTARANVIQSRADKRIIKAESKGQARQTRAQGAAEAKVLRAPNQYKSVEAISKAASNVGIAAAASLGAASIAKSASQAIAAKKASGQTLTPQEEAQLTNAKLRAQSGTEIDSENDGLPSTIGSESSLNSGLSKKPSQAGFGGPLLWVTVGLVVIAGIGYVMSPKGGKKAA